MLLSLSRIGKISYFLLAGCLLLGCISSNTPATKFYVLNPLDPGESLLKDTDPKEPLSLEVASLRLPQYLERPQIVTRSTGNRLELAEFHQWGGNLRKNMMRVLAKNLSQLLATPNVFLSPHQPQTPPDFRIDIEVMKFERDPDGKVRLSVQWILSRGQDRKPLITQMTDLTGQEEQTESDLETTVSSMSALMGELSVIISREILKTLHEQA